MIPLLCPCCKKALFREEKRFVCENSHSFDLARQGYVNLLIGSSTRAHGDDKAMCRARRDFLEKGYYKELLGAVSRILSEELKDGFSVLDAGCGEGYYTAGIASSLEKEGKRGEFFGIDISKNALALCGSRFGKKENVTLAVSSVYEMPFPDECFDALLSFFAPYSEAEFLRVLKPGGLLLRALPEEKHLLSLKKAVYETVYENEKKAEVGQGFTDPVEKRLEGRIFLEDGADIKNLFFMTPYAHKTSPKDLEKLERLTSLETEIDFGIIKSYKK